MAAADERLRHVSLKVKRAKEHVADTERELKTFLDGNPYAVSAKRDPQTRKPIYYVSSVKDVPDCIALIAGDAIQNLMSALDHLAYQLVCSDTGDAPPNPNRIYFPIADDATKYEAKKARKMEGAAKETFDAIDAIKPYKGGNDFLWVLHRLNNIEKHRLLLTVGSQAAGVNIAQHISKEMKTVFRPEAIKAFESMTLFVMPADKGFPLKEGFELLIGGPDDEINPKQQFRFTVAINEPGIAEGQPLVETLHQLTTLVEGIVSSLTPRLK